MFNQNVRKRIYLVPKCTKTDIFSSQMLKNLDFKHVTYCEFVFLVLIQLNDVLYCPLELRI